MDTNVNGWLKITQGNNIFVRHFADSYTVAGYHVDHYTRYGSATEPVIVLTVAEQEKQVAALRAAQQCISDFLGVYRNGASMLIMDLAVNSLKNDALKKIDAVLREIDEQEPAP